MTRALILLAGLAIGFGALPILWTESVPAFSVANFVVGGLFVVAALALGVARARGATGAPIFRRTLARGVAGVLAVVAVAVVAERLAARSALQIDFSSERRYELAPAVVDALADLAETGPLQAFLYHDAQDPRVRSTRLLLQTLASHGEVRVEEREIEDHPEDEDCFAIGSSNTVVFTLGEGPPCGRRFARADRPTEGTIFESLYRLRNLRRQVIVVARGAGEGDLGAGGDTGYSGLREALRTEGFDPVPIALAGAAEIPPGADAVLLVAPKRALPRSALEALDRYLESGGRMVALIEPGAEDGLAWLLERWGFHVLPGRVVDPLAAEVAGEPRGLAPLVARYSRRHPITEVLSANQMTFFGGTAALELRKPRPDDRLEAFAWSSRESWIASDPSMLDERSPRDPPPGATPRHHVVAASGSFPRDSGEARVVVFGDAALGSNRYLRTLYNLDLLMNAVQWVAHREPEITIRPKVAVSGGLQFPIPLESTLTLFQGLGLLIPELLLASALIAWIRSKA